jgi:hypothetical protein
MRKETTIKYIADDGVEFLYRKECERHELILALACKIESSIEYLNGRLEGSPTEIAHTVFELHESMGYGTPRPIETREEFAECIARALREFGWPHGSFNVKEYIDSATKHLSEQLYRGGE